MAGRLIPERYRSWFLGLSVRERTLVAALGGIALLMLFWFAVAVPLMDFRGAARAAHAAALEDRAEADALLAQLGGGGAPADAAVEEVRAIFARAGLRPSIRAEEGSLSVTIEAVRADVLFNLLGRLEGEAGLTVASAAVAANADATLSAELSLSRAAG